MLEDIKIELPPEEKIKVGETEDYYGYRNNKDEDIKVFLKKSPAPNDLPMNSLFEKIKNIFTF